jgi:2-hydroxychromene-2-carboxylate isomerase
LGGVFPFVSDHASGIDGDFWVDDETARAGLDPAEIDRVVDSEAERLNAVIEESQVAQRAAGHYGVPMIAFNNEPFFGQDRFDQFKWRLEQQGLKAR